MQSPLAKGFFEERQAAEAMFDAAVKQIQWFSLIIENVSINDLCFGAFDICDEACMLYIYYK